MNHHIFWQLYLLHVWGRLYNYLDIYSFTIYQSISCFIDQHIFPPKSKNWGWISKVKSKAFHKFTFKQLSRVDAKINYCFLQNVEETFKTHNFLLQGTYSSERPFLFSLAFSMLEEGRRKSEIERKKKKWGKRSRTWKSFNHSLAEFENLKQ